MSEYIHPDVADSFRLAYSGFTSCSEGGFVSCPPFVVASVAIRRVVPEATLELPEGYDEETLGRVSRLTGWPGRDVHISFRQATELALIGQGIRDLDEAGQIQAPLQDFEGQSIRHLIRQVVSLNFEGMSDDQVTPEDMLFMMAAAEQLRPM